MAVGAAAVLEAAPGAPDNPPAWDPEQAARYLDDRLSVWLEKATKVRTGEGRTACISCHTVVPYLLVRPVLRRFQRVSQPTPQEAILLGDLTRRVETYGRHEPIYAPDVDGSEGTEAVLNALVLAREDAGQQRAQQSAPTQKAFERLWAKQRSDGAWNWLDLGQEPNEAADGQYYGAALAAFAVGTAPGLVGGPAADGADPVERLRAYLKREDAAQNLYNRAWLLLAASRLTGLLTPAQRAGLTVELEHSQNEDGGWSLSTLGPWRWSKTAPPFEPPGKPDAGRMAKSDGYATGLIAYALRQAGTPLDSPSLRKAMTWLEVNQREFQVGEQRWKCWRAHSLNHDREDGGVRGEPLKRMVMSDAATAFAVLALLPAD